MTDKLNELIESAIWDGLMLEDATPHHGQDWVDRESDFIYAYVDMSVVAAHIAATVRDFRIVRTQAELDALHHVVPCVIREYRPDAAPDEDDFWFPQIWEMAMQSGWVRAGMGFDPDDCSPQLPVEVLWRPENMEGING